MHKGAKCHSRDVFWECWDTEGMWVPASGRTLKYEQSSTRWTWWDILSQGRAHVNTWCQKQSREHWEVRPLSVAVLPHL